MISPAFFKHGDLFDAEFESNLPLRVAYAGLWCVADREGRFEWKPRELKCDVLPHDGVDFSKVLDTLERYSFVRRYVVNGKAYGWIPTLRDHQHFHKREQPSHLPPPEDSENPGVVVTPEHRPGTGQGTALHRTSTGRSRARVVLDPPDTDTDTDTDTASTAFKEAWQIYPKRAGGNPKSAAWRQWSKRLLEGVAAQDMLAGTQRYRAYCDATRKTGGEFVKLASTFYGRDHHFAEPYALPSWNGNEQPERRYDSVDEVWERFPSGVPETVP